MPYQLYYPDYIDKATGKTLVVTAGSAYTIALAPGRNAATPGYPNDGRWTNASTFLNFSAEDPASQPAVTVKPSVELNTSTSKDKDKGGA